jgi:uncharacterized protein
LILKQKLLVFFHVGMLFITSAALSLEIPERPKGRVSDYARILSREQIDVLDAKLQKYEKETTNQVAVAIFNNLEGESLEDFSIRLAEKWKIGTASRDNGVILLIFLDDRKMRVEVGYGLEGALTDATADSIIRNFIAPRFRQGDYYGGISAGIEKIIEATKGEYKAEPGSGEGAGEDNFNIILLSVIILALVLIIWEQRRQNSYTFERGGWSSGRGFPRGRWGYGGGRRGRDRSPGGGFSGGGGGFGGGGASGGW